MRRSRWFGDGVFYLAIVVAGLSLLPADTAFTFQTLDQHAHSQEPTPFAATLAARKDYQVWDLVNNTPLVSDRKLDESKQQWDAENQTGLRYAKEEVVNVEHHRHIKPILQRHCVSCHTARGGKPPKGNLDLDADDQLIDVPNVGKLPGTYYRLAAHENRVFHRRFLCSWESARDHSVGRSRNSRSTRVPSEGLVETPALARFSEFTARN